MKSFKQYISEFQGWPSADDSSVETISDAIRAIESTKEWQKYHEWGQVILACDNQDLLDYLNSDNLELDDKEFICASLKMTGMLSTENANGFEFVDPIKGKLSMYDDELGDDDINITFCYDINNYPKEFEEIGNKDTKRGYFYVYSQDCEKEMFSHRHGKIPHVGLQWVMSTTSGVFPGYWCRDDRAKQDMMDYCGFEEFKNGKIINK